jgi:hypothetical protein
MVKAEVMNHTSHTTDFLMPITCII